MIYALIKEEAEKLKKADMDLLTRKALARIKKEQLEEEALEEMVRQFCREVVGMERRNTRAGSPQRSDKWDKARNVFAHPVFSMWEYVGGEYKYLGDCTIEDVQEIVEDKMGKALSYQRIANKYEDLVRLMKNENAKKVKELDGEDVAEVLADEEELNDEV